jgi:HAD superfamily hydrolase (TIGR01490 family)
MNPSKKHLVLFDMDKTLVSADTTILWSEFLDQKGFMTKDDWQKRLKFADDYTKNKLDVDASYQFELDLLRRIPFELREGWRQEFFDGQVKTHISKAGLQLIQEYKNQPDTLVLLITATISFIAEPVASYAQVHDAIATQEELKDGEYTGRLADIPCLGHGKVKHFKQWLQKKQIEPLHTILYSDSINDQPLLSTVKTPIAVDPDEHLRQVALARNWDIVSFNNANYDSFQAKAVPLYE